MANKEAKREEVICSCPYCDAHVAEEIPPFCSVCGVTLRRCSTCLVVVDKEATVCPGCGQALD